MQEPSRNFHAAAIQVSYHENMAARIAADLIRPYQGETTLDLSGSIVWCRTPLARRQLQQALLQEAKNHHIGYLFPPRISALKEWVLAHTELSRELLTEAIKQFIIAESVRGHQPFFGHFSPWEIARELLVFFDDLQQTGQYSVLQKEFRHTLQLAYGAPDNITCFSRECQVILHLWEQWLAYVRESHFQDPVEIYCRQLLKPVLPENTRFYAFDYPRLTHCESRLIQTLLASKRLRFYAYELPKELTNYERTGTNSNVKTSSISSARRDGDESEKARALQIIFNTRLSLAQRAATLRESFSHNPLTTSTGILTCENVEQHAHAITLQTRRWLLRNVRQPIGIVCNDRLLARRLRALFERAGISVTDYGGWALSTTSAAAFIEQWLNFMEQSVSYQTVCKLFLSPFIRASHPLFAQQTSCLTIFEQLQKFADQPLSRRQTAELFAKILSDSDIQALQDFLHMTATFFKRGHILRQQREFELQDATKLLITSLRETGVFDALREDAAGKVLLDVICSSLVPAGHYPIRVAWEEWRSWLHQIMENEYFIPESTDRRVLLCNLEQATHLDFDCVIMAGSEEQRLVGTPPSYTFFNEQVRKELGLTHWQEQKNIRYSCFRTILGQAKEVLFTAEESIGGEMTPLAYWVQQLEIISQAAFSDSLHDIELLELSNHPKSILRHNEPQIEIKKTEMARAHMPGVQPPTVYSATMYQTLLDCPYRFFARYGLKLKKPENENEWNASRYGRIVHAILRQFHFGEHTLKQELNSQLSTSQREQAIQQLLTLSRIHFNQDYHQTTLARAWQLKWEQQIPSYVDWQIKQSHRAIPEQGEYIAQITLDEDAVLQGQIDRIDRAEGGQHVMDYKSGASLPSKTQVEAGEQVQLLCYSSLLENVCEVYYIDLNTPGNVGPQVVLSQHKLQDISRDNLARLRILHHAIQAGADLPAWGDEKICGHCEFEGMCRKSHWIHTQSNMESSGSVKE